MRAFSYSAPQAAFADEVRTWLSEHFVGEFRELNSRQGDDAWKLHLAWDKELAQGGWIGLTWPTDYGGRGASAGEQLIFNIEYAQAGAPIRSGQLGDSPVGPTLLLFGTEEQKRHFLPRITRGEDVWAQGYSEPDAGSDLAGIRTRARLENDEWVIDGQKIWTTNGDHANWCFVLARTDSSAPRHRGLSYLLCPMHQPGIQVHKIETMSAGAAFDFAEVFFDGARTAADCIVGEPGEGWRVAMGTLGHERTTALLNSEFACDAHFDMLLDRAQREGITANPIIRDRLADAYIGLRIIQFRNEELMNRLLHDAEIGPEASITKLAWTEWDRKFCALSMNVLGIASTVLPGSAGSYLLDEFQRSFIESMAGTIWAGTSEIQRNIIAERVLGLPKEL